MVNERNNTYMEDNLVAKSANAWCEEAKSIENPVPLWKNLWHEGEAACLFSDSNAGKSIYAVQIAEEIAGNGKRVIYFDFEQSAKQFQLRYTDDNGVMYRFNDNFLRSEIDCCNIVSSVKAGDLVDQIMSMADRAEADIIIIDNLTFMCADSENGIAAHDFMVKLIEYKKVWNLSILVLAHTPKRENNSPITQNDLAGSKRLFNFFDSVFAIGRSSQGDDMRYIKQLKARLCPITLGENSVLSARIVKEEGFLHFKHLSKCVEKEHLKPVGGYNYLTDEQRDTILSLRQEGKSYRDIAQITGVSKSNVARVVNGES